MIAGQKRGVRLVGRLIGLGARALRSVAAEPSQLTALSALDAAGDLPSTSTTWRARISMKQPYHILVKKRWQGLLTCTRSGRANQWAIQCSR